jgi:rhodanese-related sulfurtransferase
MNWTLLPLLVAAVALVLMVRSSSTLPAVDARRLLQSGGVVVDVRTEEEHRADPVAGSVNLPLDGVVDAVPKRFPSKDTPLLLHCRSGARSDVALRRLTAIGYRNVHNLGGVGEARRAVDGR